MNNLLIYHGLVGGGDGRTSSGGTRTPKDLAKKLAKMQSIADKTGEDFEPENVYYDRFDGQNKKSLGQIDLTSFEITTNSSNIINTNDTVNLAKLKSGQEVTLLNGSHIERVIIDTIEENFFTINTPIEANKYNGGTVARSMATISNGKLLLVPSDAPEYDIRYKIIPKEKQPNKIYTWVKYDNPSECSSYDSIVNKAEENLTHYEGVNINSATVNEEQFKLILNINTPSIATDVKLYINYGEDATEENYKNMLEIDSRGETITKEIPIPSLDKSIHYRFICKYEDGTVNDSIYQSGVYKIEGVYKHCLRIDKTVSEPDLAVEYINGTEDILNWDDVEPFNQIRPVVLNSSGEVVSEINKNNFGETVDGSIISSDFDETDTMIEFPKIYWKTLSTDTYIDITISNKKVEPNMVAYAHTTGNKEKDFLYVGAYRGVENNSKYYSKFNRNATQSIHLVNARKFAKARGEGYGLFNWNTLNLIKILFLFRFKTLNSQKVLGRGNISYTSSQNGYLRTIGLFSDPVKLQNKATNVKLFGIEEIWGSGCNFVDGVFVKNDEMKIAIDNLDTSPDSDNLEIIPITLEGTYTSGRLEDVIGECRGLFYAKKVSNQSYDKFYCDLFQTVVSTSYSAIATPCYDNTGSGLFAINNSSLNHSGSSYYHRIIYL